MAAFVPLLGETLTGQAGPVATADALAGKTVGLYFSAHWCPPCRGFTPQLAKIYNDLKADGKPFEIVFVSSDKSEEQFTEYHAEQPWLALPYADRAAKAKLSKRFKVSGIPTLVILDEHAETVTTDGRSAVGDPAAFPWTPPTMQELLARPLVRPGADGGEVSTADALAGKYVGLYFSAHWCPPCKRFTPELVKAYNAVKAAGKELEIVFVSSDRDQAQFDEYHASMPWLALPYANRSAKDKLSSKFDVQGIPSFVLLNPDLSTANASARGAVNADAATFPWLPKLVNDIDESADGINDTPALVVLMEEAADAWDDVEATLAEIAGAAREAGDETLFFVAKETGGIAGQVRKLTKLGNAKDDEPAVLLLDLADDGAFFSAGADVSKAALASVLARHKAGTLEMARIPQ